MMSRPTRSRQASVKLSSEEYEIPKLTKLTKTRNATNKLRSTKGSKNEIINADILNSLQSPVLRDRTNLSKERNTKLDISKKSLKNYTEVKKVTSSKQAKITKPKINDTENISVIVTKMKDPVQISRKDSKLLGTKKPVVVLTSRVNSITKTSGENTQSARTSRTTKNSTKNTNSDNKFSTNTTTPKEQFVSKPQVNSTEKMQTRKKGVPGDKLQSPAKTSTNSSKQRKTLSSNRETTANKILKRSVRLSTNKNTDKSTKTTNGKKFFKSKLKTPINVQAHSKISPLKRPLISKTRKATTNRTKNVKKLTSRQSPTFRLRQPTLKESFSKQSKKTLRPRKISKNYCDESQLINNQEANKNKLKNTDEKKGPVYKLLNNTDENNTDKDKVYEFVFDCNDSKERATRKRKKRMTRKKPVKRVKIGETKTDPQPTSSQELPATKIPKPPAAVTKSTKVLTDKHNPKDEDKKITKVPEIHLPSLEVSHEHHTDVISENNIPEITTNSQTFTGPQICSIKKLKNEHCINFTTTPLQPRSIDNDTDSSNKKIKFNLRPSMQVKSMMNAPLLRKSLSPITNIISKENFETSSPWRAPIINTFSRVKNIYQSTPQGKKFAILLGKTSFHNTEQTQKLEVGNMNKTSEENDENANISMIQNSSQKNRNKNTSKSPRKFGTIISNLQENSPIKQQSPQRNTSKSPRQFGTVISNINESKPKVSPITNRHSRISITAEPSVINNSINTSIPMNNSGILSVDNQYVHDKENSSPNNKSSIKSPSKGANILCVTPLRSRIIQESANNPKTKIIESQPGPSYSKESNPSVVNDMRNFRQSNLNKFLNLPDMPNSTIIRTAHGIFDDPHSTPMIKKTIKKFSTENLNVNNAFGFDDDSMGDIDVSPINRCTPELKSQIVLKNKLATKTISELQKCDDKNNFACAVNQPARFSIGDVKKAFFTRKEINKEKIDNKSEKQEAKDKSEKLRVEDKNEKQKIETVYTNKKNVVQTINFSDTFDNINNEADKENMENIPLFIDLEPIHFTQPPRYSYAHKRKRNMSYDTSEETEEDEIPEEDRSHAKKRKLGKAAREQKKILDQWAKNMNNTFEEIEHYDLVVE